MFYALLSGFATAFAAPMLYRLLKDKSSLVLSLFLASLFIFFATYLPPVLNGQTFLYQIDWVPQLQINLAFLVDGLSLLFALLITGFGALVVYYAGSYLKGDLLLGRFYLYLLLFASAMLGLVLSDNLFSIFVFWELTSISSYLLIGYKNTSETARASALQALLVTSLGGLSLMAGFILLQLASGSGSLSEIILNNHIIRQHEFYRAILVLVLIGAFTKSAQFPFHFWLPNAMAAPTPVSAYLHSATMVKAGIYLLARLFPVLGNTPEWQYALMACGGITMLLGALLAVHQYDLKKILAYSTVSSLGMLVLMLGIGTEYAVKAAIAFLLGHALYKAALFLVAGTVDHSTGTRDIRSLSGLRHTMPFTALTAALAGLSMAGVLPFFGFIAKEALYEAALHAPFFSNLLIGALVLANALTAVVAFMLSYELFAGKAPDKTLEIHKPPLATDLPPLLLAIAGLLLGLLPALTAQSILAHSSNSILRQGHELKLQLWHGLNFVLLLSVLTLALGLALFFFRKKIRRWSEHFIMLNKAGPAALYHHLLSLLKKTAYHQTRVLQNGYLRSYISIIISVFIYGIFFTVFHYNIRLKSETWLNTWTDIRIYELALLLLMLASLIYLFITKSRLTAVATMGLIGYCIATVFIFFGAPDVAIAQFLIETLTVVLFVLILHKLPSFKLKVTLNHHYKYAILSTLFGSTMAFMLLLVKGYPQLTTLKDYFGENSLKLGKGHNIVNVILVDFRAMDTLGEITVLAITAIGITALLNLKLKGKENA